MACIAVCLNEVKILGEGWDGKIRGKVLYMFFVRVKEEERDKV